jgi:hypothetical protein
MKYLVMLVIERIKMGRGDQHVCMSASQVSLVNVIRHLGDVMSRLQQAGCFI